MRIVSVFVSVAGSAGATGIHIANPDPDAYPYIACFCKFSTNFISLFLVIRNFWFDWVRQKAWIKNLCEKEGSRCILNGAIMTCMFQDEKIA
jgi:hypothetical protein